MALTKCYAFLNKQKFYLEQHVGCLNLAVLSCPLLLACARDAWVCCGFVPEGWAGSPPAAGGGFCILATQQYLRNSF